MPVSTGPVTLDAADESITQSMNNPGAPLVSANFHLISTSATTPVVKVQARPRGQSSWVNVSSINLTSLSLLTGGNQTLSNSTDYILEVPNIGWADAVRLYVVSIASGSYSAMAYGLSAQETQDMQYTFPVVNANVAQTITSTSATALAVGANGSTNPVFSVNANTASVATGLTVVGAAAAGGVALNVISSGTDEALNINAKGAGVLSLNPTGTGQIYMSRGADKVFVQSLTVTSLGTAQSSAPTIAQLLTGVVTQTGSTGAGAVTVPTGTAISAGMPLTPAAGDSFDVLFCNLGGSQTLTITGQTGSTVVGDAVVDSGTNKRLKFVNTGSNAWNVYCW